MHKYLLELLADPIAKTPMQLDVYASDPNGQVLQGALSTANGQSYPITNGIPRLVVTEDTDQRRTGASFGFKWRQRESYESPRFRREIQEWLVRRYAFDSGDEMQRFFGARRRILDAGCGSGFTTSLWMTPAWRGSGQAQWVGIDVSGAIDVARERLGDCPGTHFIQADILHLPLRAETFDAVYSEGVLHHTPSTGRALKAVVDVLETGGEILFYVYRRKGPVREFTDDYIRSVISRLDASEAWAALRPLTRLAQALAELGAEVVVPEDIPYLGIRAGRHDVQRLIYWHFAKLFWREGFSFEENHHVNFDWYHPAYAHRHTEDEIRRWCDEAGLTVKHFDAQESGYTVRAIKV